MVRCAPPQNKPAASERHNCAVYLRKELALMRNQLKVIICLGGMAFAQFCRLEGFKGLDFGHLFTYTMKGYPTIITSYHPSRQNTNTGRLQWDEWVKVFDVASHIVGNP
jgi:uracil-DNA glycosylase family 4